MVLGRRCGVRRHEAVQCRSVVEIGHLKDQVGALRACEHGCLRGRGPREGDVL